MQAADADLTLAAPPAVLTDAGATAFLAEVALPPMLTDAGTAAFPADLAMLSVLADAGAATGFAGAAPPPMLAEVTAAALLAVAAPPPVLADAAAAALPALCAPPAMRTRRGHDDRPNPASDWAVLRTAAPRVVACRKGCCRSRVASKGDKTRKRDNWVFFCDRFAPYGFLAAFTAFY